MKRLESIPIAHLLLEEILDAEGSSDWSFILYLKVKPLEMGHGVTIRLYEEIKRVTARTDHVFQVSALKGGIEAEITIDKKTGWPVMRKGMPGCELTQ
jgi:hypothetical protein